MVVCFLLSVIAGTGVGGGGLFLVYLTGSMGFAQTSAQSLNLFYFLAAAIPTVITRFRFLPWRKAALCILGGVPGVFLGSSVRSLLSEGLLSDIFGSLLLAAGICVFLVREKR